MSKVEEKIKALGLTLPEPPKPGGVYATVQRAGNMLYASGQVPIVDGEFTAIGKVGAEVTPEQAYEAAKVCALRLISALSAEADLDNLQMVHMTGFVNAAPGFYSAPAVINGASELFEAAFGERGKHARSAVGVASLPRNCAVEVEISAMDLSKA